MTFLGSRSVIPYCLLVLLLSMVRYLPLIGCLILTCSLGYSIGRITTVQLKRTTIQTSIHTIQPDLEPIVNIDGIRNGYVEGTINGGARLFFDGKQILTDEEGIFHTESNPLLTNIITVEIPKGMRYVASKKGKKYYSVTESQANRLSPKNRIYFLTADDAEEAGYLK